MQFLPDIINILKTISELTLDHQHAHVDIIHDIRDIIIREIIIIKRHNNC